MKLTLLDAEHGHDPDGLLYVRHPGGWRPADEPPADAPFVMLPDWDGNWLPVPYSKIEMEFNKGGIPVKLRLDGHPVHGPFRLLSTDEHGRRSYVEMEA